LAAAALSSAAATRTRPAWSLLNIVSTLFKYVQIQSNIVQP
jgi:hypothetical protein